MRPTVLIVDDHAAFRASARALLQAEGFEVIGEATDGAEAVEAVAIMRPQIVLLDIQLPDLDGLTVAEQLAAAPDPPAVVLVTPSRVSSAARSLSRRADPTGTVDFPTMSESLVAALAMALTDALT